MKCILLICIRKDVPYFEAGRSPWINWPYKKESKHNKRKNAQFLVNLPTSSKTIEFLITMCNLFIQKLHWGFWKCQCNFNFSTATFRKITSFLSGNFHCVLTCYIMCRKGGCSFLDGQQKTHRTFSILLFWLF